MKLPQYAIGKKVDGENKKDIEKKLSIWYNYYRWKENSKMKELLMLVIVAVVCFILGWNTHKTFIEE